MPQSEALHRAADRILQIELAMRQAQLWREQTPTPAAMASRVPFCADTLDFSAWLQFVFLPRMRMQIEAGKPLPATSNIAAMADHSLPDSAGKQDLLAAIQAFDALIETNAARTHP